MKFVIDSFKDINIKDAPLLLFALYPLFFSEKRGVLVGILLVSALVLLFKGKQIKVRRGLIINSAIYFVYLISFLLLSSDKSTFKVFETGASLIIFPFVFLVYFYNYKEILSQRIEIKFFSIFYWSCFVYSLIGFLYVFFSYLKNSNEPFHFFINQLNNKIPIVYDHPIYSSMLLGIAILFMAKRIIVDMKNTHIFQWISLILIVLFLFFLSRKGVIIAAVFSTLFLFKEKFLKNGILLALFTALLIFIIPSTRKRMYSLFNQESYVEKNETNSTNNRINIYKCAIKKIKEKPFLGYGINDDKKALYNCYKENLYYLNENKFNTHNQYLSVLMKSGIIGLIIFMFMLVYNLRMAVITNDRLFLVLLIYFTAIMMFENILERQNGVMIFSFIINYFAFKSLQKNDLYNET
ncbi:O-antigen ligase family protein [Flavobacteriaceae bacterium]|jgi:O-antigen ligase|nr:O-antigen ligase family protein [Flavobacteriaceae bacterium]